MNDSVWDAVWVRYAAAPSVEDRDALVEGYLPLSRAIAGKFAGRGVETEDLEQVAALALMKAVERFDINRGLRFSTYATPTIAGEVRNYLRDKSTAIRLRRDTRSELYRMQQVRDQLTASLKREPSMMELAQAMNITPDRLLDLLDQRSAADMLSLSAPASLQEDAQSLEETLGSMEQGYEQVEQKDWMSWVRRQLTEREQTLLDLRFIRRMGQRDCAAALGVSQMQVSRMERKMLAKLREKMEQNE